MLIEFSVENFRSFKERQTLSLVASNDKALEGNLIPCENDDLLKAVAVYGANASGKSNLVKAISAMDSFIQRSATKMTQGDEIPGADPFRLDVKTPSEPTTFEIVLIIDDVRYVYGFSVTSERVIGEWLDAFPKGRAQRWIERSSDDPASWEFGTVFSKEDKSILRKMTRPNGLILSRGAELNMGSLSKLFLWFREKLGYLGVWVSSEVLRQRTAQLMKNDKTFHARVTRLLRHADMGISDIRLTEKSMQLDDMPSAVREMFSDDQIKKFAEGSVIDIKSLHRIDGKGATVEFDFEQTESEGTKRFFALAGRALDALDKGALVVADELDCSMHPHLTRKLIELFQNPELNTKGAQLIFTTHDTTLMDHTLFRRDQIWFTEKNSHGATELFSLYDFKTEEGRPRNNEAFERRYLAGRYGAVPQFGPALEDADLE